MRAVVRRPYDVDTNKRTPLAFPSGADRDGVASLLSLAPANPGEVERGRIPLGQIRALPRRSAAGCPDRPSDRAWQGRFRVRRFSDLHEQFALAGFLLLRLPLCLSGR